MEKFRRIVKWVFLGAGSLLLLVISAVVIYARSEHFTRWLREEAVAAVNHIIRGSISVDRLEGSVWRNVTLHNVALRYEDAEIFAVPRLEGLLLFWRAGCGG